METDQAELPAHTMSQGNNTPTSSSTIKQDVQGNAHIIAGRDVNITKMEGIPSEPVGIFKLFDAPTRYFTGRESIIEQIHERFKVCFNETSYELRTVVLHGMGGIGKSELARSYANRHHNDAIIKNVAWIDAETETSLRSSFLSLAKELKLPTNLENTKQIVLSIYQHFSKHVGAGLFIFDNAPQMNRTKTQFGIYDFLPKQVLERLPLVLVTTRDNEWDGISDENTIRVEELTDTESVEFVLKALKLTSEQKKDETEMLAVKTLSKTFQGYALGLSLATSNIRNAKWTAIAAQIEKYIQRMNVPNGRWALQGFSTGAATNYSLIMSNVWSASLDQIASLQDEGTDALNILNLMAYLPTDKITVENVSDVFKFVFKKCCYEESFVLLEKYSFINVITPTSGHIKRIRIHRLVQHYTRDKLGGEKDDTFLFEICNYMIETEKWLYEHTRLMHDFLKQRNWPGDSIKYSVMFCSQCFISFLYRHAEGWDYIMDAKSFLDSWNNDYSEDALLEILFHLCLAYYWTTDHYKYNLNEIFDNISLKTKVKEVTLGFAKDYLRHLLEGALYNPYSDCINSKLVTELCYVVCHQIFARDSALVKKEFKSDFKIFEHVTAHLNSSKQRPLKVKAAIKVYELLWTRSGDDLSASVVQAFNCAAKIHHQMQPTLLTLTHIKSLKYWFSGGPLKYNNIRERLDDDDWGTALLDAFFDEGGLQISNQHLMFISAGVDEDDFYGAAYLLELIIELAFEWDCSSKFIRDADFMESLLLSSKRLFSIQGLYLEDSEQLCIIVWFCLFRHNETVADSRSRSWSINDVTQEISLVLTCDYLDWLIDKFKKYVDVFKTFLEAAKDDPGSDAMELAKEVVQYVRDLQLRAQVTALRKECKPEFEIFEHLMAHLNSSYQGPDKVKTANIVYNLLWAGLEDGLSSSAVQAVNCAAKIHHRMKPTLLTVSHNKLQEYWNYYSPLYYNNIRRGLHDADWRTAFLDAFFDEGGLQISTQHLMFTSTSVDEGNFDSAGGLVEFIIDLAFKWNCSSKLIGDAEFMESLLLCSKRLFSLRSEYLLGDEARCIVVWFSLFGHNETVADCRGRSWSINDVTHEISLVLTSDKLGRYMVWFKLHVDVFKTFVEATKDEPESDAVKLAKKVVEFFSDITEED